VPCNTDKLLTIGPPRVHVEVEHRARHDLALYSGREITAYTEGTARGARKRLALSSSGTRSSSMRWLAGATPFCAQICAFTSPIVSVGRTLTVSAHVVSECRMRRSIAMVIRSVPRMSACAEGWRVGAGVYY
jgi:hypothetical protein